MIKQLRDNLYWTGILDKDLRVFDIIMRTAYGSTYNSYLLKGSEKTALIETAKINFWDAYFASLQEITNLSEIDYIVLNHAEPDHSGSIVKLLELNPNLKIVGTNAAIGFLKQIVNRDFPHIVVKDNDTLSLGDKTLRFMALPNLHWPDTMFTYVEEDHVLFSCDVFGAHYSHEGILRSTVTDTEAYLGTVKYYFDNILGPFIHPFMINALNRVRELPIEMICTGHGPVLDSHIPEIFALYESWCNVKNPNIKKTVVIPYVSAYGYTRLLSTCIEQGLHNAGDIAVRRYDLVETDPASVLADMQFADGILFGTPTILGDALEPIWKLTLSMFPQTHGGKYAGVFGSYGWSGEGVPNLTERLKQLRLKVVDGLRVRFQPDEAQQQEAIAFGYRFGRLLLGKPEKP